MLALLFCIGDVTYIIKGDKIREIAPMVALKKVPQSPVFFAGYFNYRGTIVPVIDLCQLIQGRPCQLRLSTRIILIDYSGKNTTSHILGLIAERVTEAVKKSGQAFSSPSIRSEEAPYLGGIVMDGDRMIQYLDLDCLPDCVDFLPMAENSGGDVPVKN